MATIGVSKPYFGKYVNTDGVITYEGGGVFAKAIEFSASVESGEDNNLYADNAIAESDRSFSGGTISVTTDDIEPDVAAILLGITANTISVGGASASELVYDDDMSVPDLGFGIIIKKKKDGVDKFRAVFFHKIKFNIPEDAATTQGESIEWQTPTLEGTIMRDDSAKRGWKSEVTVSSEAVAQAYLMQKLGLVLSELSVTSLAGSLPGDTEITVAPALTDGNSYVYKVGAGVTAPAYDEVCTAGWTAWDGVADITATTGTTIVVVEVDADSKAKKAGTATVVSADE